MRLPLLATGLLLAAHLDAAFDAFLVSFDDDGRIAISPKLTDIDRNTLGIRSDLRLRKLAPGHLPQLAWHRAVSINHGNF